VSHQKGLTVKIRSPPPKKLYYWHNGQYWVNSALHPSGVAKSSRPTSFGWGKGWNVTSAGWQVTLCDPIWHVSSSSDVATSVCELLYPCYFTLPLYNSNAMTTVSVPQNGLPVDVTA